MIDKTLSSPHWTEKDKNEEKISDLINKQLRDNSDDERLK